MDSMDSASGRESVLVGKQNCGRRPVGLGDDPDVQAALRPVDGEQPLSGLQGLFVSPPIVLADIAPIAVDVAAQEIVG